MTRLDSIDAALGPIRAVAKTNETIDSLETILLDLIVSQDLTFKGYAAITKQLDNLYTRLRAERQT